MAVNLLVEIYAGEIAREPLEGHAGTVDLSDCLMFYFDSDPAFQVTPRLRLVYLAGAKCSTLQGEGGQRQRNASHRYPKR